MLKTIGSPLLPLTRGMLALGLLASGLSIAPDLSVRALQAQEINCDDEANLKDWDCIQRRAGQQTGGPAAPPASDAPSDAPPAPDTVAKAGDPMAIIFTLEDAGKEATQFIAEQGEDGRGRWARSRHERQNDISASKLGPNVLDTRAWVAKDVETARALFMEQAAIKNFPERRRDEGISGPNERLKPFNVAEETFMIGTYWEDNTIWQHYRVVMRKGQNVAVMYLYGREALFTEGTADKDPNGKLMEWFARKLAGRL